MDQGSVYKIRTAQKHMPRQFILNECFFHILFKSFETRTKHFIGGRSWMLPLGRWLHGYKTSSVQQKSCISNYKIMMTERGQFHHDSVWLLAFCQSSTLIPTYNANSQFF